jgi:cytochrome c553
VGIGNCGRCHGRQGRCPATRHSKTCKIGLGQ